MEWGEAMKAYALSIYALALLAAVAVTAQAQDVISERREIMHGTVAPIGTSSILRDTPGMRVTPGGPIPGTVSTTQDTVVRVLAFQLPDFNPEDLYTHNYHVGMFSDNGNGSGTVFPDDTGYLEFEQHTPVGETPMTTFLYSVHIETSEVRVFIDVDAITVNKAAQVLTNLALNGGGPRSLRPFNPSQSRPRMPPAVGDQRVVTWSGDNLTLEDLQDQIFEQTGCDVDRLADDFLYQIVSCD
jgi:hypothetical protein